MGVIPFFAYTTVFLLIPTLVVIVGAFLDADGEVAVEEVPEGVPAKTYLKTRMRKVVAEVAARLEAAEDTQED